LAQYHLSIADINKVVNTAFAGQSTGLVFEEEKRFDLVVKLNASDRKNLEDVSRLLIPIPSGNQIPLSQLAEVEIKEGPNQIQRENAHRRIIVGFNVKGRDVQSIVKELQGKVDQQIKLPTGYSITYGGSFENLNQAKARLMIAVPISLLLIFILLFFAFKSIKESLLIYTAIPLSIIGGVFFLALRELPFSISAGVGFIALFGVAVLNGIVLISEFNRLKKSGLTNHIRIIVQGSRTRLRPVLMTAAVASLGFIPMALSNGAGAEVQRPLATVVSEGLIVATLLTLCVLPLLFLIYEEGVKMKRIGKKTLTIEILLSLSLIGKVNAQIPITLDKAIELGLRNNQNLKSEKLRSEYERAFIKTYLDIPQTSLGVGYGQINGPYNDTGFSISQNIAFPTVYKRQKDLFTEEWKLGLLNVSMTEYELSKTITQVFYSILYWQEKEKLLKSADTLYRNFYEKASLRLQKGESNILEKTMAENQRASIILQLKQVHQE